MAVPAQSALQIALRGVQTHHCDVRFLARGVEVNDAVQCSDGARQIGLHFKQLGELDTKTHLRLDERLTTEADPVILAVLGKQLRRRKSQGGAIIRWIARPAGPIRRGFKLTDIHQDRSVRPKDKIVCFQDQAGLTRSYLPQRLPSDVENLVEVIGRGDRVEVRPELGHDQIAEPAVVGGKRQQLDERGCFVQAPMFRIDRVISNPKPKLAQQLDAQSRGRVHDRVLPARHPNRL